MEQRKIRCLAFPFITLFVLSLVVFILGLSIFMLIFEPSRLALVENIPILICWTIMTFGLSIAILIMMAKPLLSIVQIDETGISRAFLGRFWKLHISWDELAEARYYIRVSQQMIFSKTQSLGVIPMLKWQKLKDVIFIGFSKRRFKVIKHYIQQPIVGMSQKMLERLDKTKNSNE